MGRTRGLPSDLLLRMMLERKDPKESVWYVPMMARETSLLQ